MQEREKQYVKILIHSQAQAVLYPAVWKGYSRLYMLDISFNKLSRLPSTESAFLGLKALVILNLSNNNISVLYNGNFAGMDSLMILNIFT